jgi:carbon storage regulator
MLVLRRTIGESVIIAGNVKITVIEVKAGKVKLAIDAPRDITIDREEIQLAKLREGLKDA